MVMDNLEVKPMSAYGCINLQSALNIQQADVEERVIEIRLEKGFALMEASLQSKTVLTKVFLEA
ncbi:hypothetical protein LINPERPRIM_LOCUS13539 [Linum perenne]